jgi:hypothetical protein
MRSGPLPGVPGVELDVPGVTIGAEDGVGDALPGNGNFFVCALTAGAINIEKPIIHRSKIKLI